MSDLGRRGLVVLAGVALLAPIACRSAAPVAPEASSVETSAPAPTAAAGPEEPRSDNLSNTVRWTTSSELDNFGFDVYRSLSAEGPWERINAEVIEGAGTSDEPQSYRYVDDRIEPETTYYYYVESISMEGVRKRFTPVGEAPPKRAPEAPN